jgi:hypothetical protein
VDWSDAESGLVSSTLVRTQAPLSSGTCGAFGGAVTLVGAPAQTGLTTNTCYRYTLTGTDALGNTSSLVTTVRYDTTAPTGGALTVNGTAGSAVGTQSVSTTGTFAVTRTLYADTGSGLSVSQLTRAVASSSGGVCGAFGSPSVFSAASEAALPVGCYRYTLTGTDLAGNTVSLMTTVVRI